MTISRGRRWFLVALGVFVLLALSGMALSSWLFSRWSEIRASSGEEARAALDAAAAGAGGRPYIEISGEGRVAVHRGMEGAEEQDLSVMHILGFDPADGRLYSTDLPWWFVRAKLTTSVNLGTLVSTLARDWKQLDLSITEDDLERRGPGLVLDHRTAGGGRLVIWTE